MIAMRDAYGDALVRLGEQNPQVVVLEGDLGGSIKSERFGKRFPDRYVQVGIAEQNMMGIAAGLATAGFVSVVNSFAVFAVCRSLDQIRVSVAQPGLNVKIVGAYSGLMVSKGGATHTAVEDIGIMRTLPGITVIAPGDAAEAAQVTEALGAIPGPVYLRLYRNALPSLVPEGYRFQVGKAITLRQGGDVAIISTGSMSGRAVAAAESLHAQGIEVEVVHMPTIKPLDDQAVIAAASRCRLVVTAEEHNRLGGLGSAVAECLAENLPTPVYRIGVDDRFGESGADDQLLEKFGLDAAAIQRHVLAALTRFR
jgi:transketolase